MIRMNRTLTLTFLLSMMLFWACGEKGPETLKIGDKMPHMDRKMKSIYGHQQTLEDLAGENGLLVIFTCNTCPFVKAWVDRYPKVQREAEKRGVHTVLLNSNTAKRDKGDSMEEMKRFGKEHHPEIPYLLDASNKTADAFGAKTTPHVFLFNEEFRLVYRGAIDDHHKNADKVDHFYVMDALKAMNNGKEIDPSITEAKGCGIKRD